MTKELSIPSTYMNPLVEEKITALKNDLTLLSVYAKQDSTQNKPTHIEYWRSRVYNPVQFQSEEVYNYLQQIEQPIATANRKKEVQNLSQTQTEQLRSDINYEETKLHKVEREIKSHYVNHTMKLLRLLVIVFLVLAGLGDCYLTIDAFRGGGLSFLAALLYAIPAGLAVGLGAGFAAAKYKSETRRKVKSPILGITFGAAFVFFAILGILRSNLYHSKPSISIPGATEITSSSAISITGWELAIISFMLFAAGFFFSTATAKTEKEQEMENHLWQLHLEHAAIKKSLHRKTQEMQVIQEAALREVSECIQRCEYAVSAKKRIINIAKSSLAEYASINIAHRTDGLFPSYLTEIPEINFNL